MKNIIYTPFIKSNKNDFPEITPRGYKRHYTSNDVNDSEEVTIVTEYPEEIDFSLPDINLKFTDKESFKTRMLLEYRSALEARGINPEFAKYLVPQDALETGGGSKPVGLYNYGNITGKSGKTLEVPEFLNGKWEDQKQTFKNYNSIREFVNDKIDLLSKKRYDVFSHPVTEFVSRVTSGGYATAPNYAEVLNGVIASMRKGGILKFEKGGKEYLDNNREHYNQQVGYNVIVPVGNIPYNLVTKKLDNVDIVDYPPRIMEDTGDEYNGAINRITQRIHSNKNSGWQLSKDGHAPLLPIYINSKPDAPGSVDGFKNAKEVYEYILSLPGSNPAIAAGGTGVFMKESSLDHSKVNKDSGASGIAQLLGSKRDEYNKGLKKRPNNGKNQIQWVGEKVNNGKDDGQSYYDELKRRVDNGIKLTEKEARDWGLMENSKYVNYSFNNYRNIINTMKDPGDIAELMTGTFERPGRNEADIEQRRQYANNVYKQFN